MNIETASSYPSAFERHQRIQGLISSVMDEPVDFVRVQTVGIGLLGYASGELGFDSLVNILEGCQPAASSVDQPRDEFASC